MESTWPSTHPGFWRWRSWAALLWTLALGVLLLMPGDAIDRPSGAWLALLPQSADKWVHALLFGGEVFWLERSLRRHQRRPLAVAIALAIVLAVATELGQNLSPGRDPSLGDLAANALGIAGCALTVSLTARRTGRPDKMSPP